MPETITAADDQRVADYQALKGRADTHTGPVIVESEAAVARIEDHGKIGIGPVACPGILGEERSG